ncbi:hypothetical protein [Streptomyces sp. t39]|uniref:hypothetical protein n=1 Tax=Streptomyces sp. t39 TaxID=1828156 RepID=UPI0011CE28D5|nr:hypothetical protein [Streptomyces sp. t39]TXS39663.1 hypothetical protein EAO77_36270 [Streptomyces sp. t39]
MSVFTLPARKNTAHYGDLTPTQQQHFDQLMEQADGTRISDEYNALMVGAAAIAGLTAHLGDEIALCACPHCRCDTIFDTALPGLYSLVATSPYGLARLQCQDCADDHRATEDD